jgi:hypothetical protein
MKMQSRKMDAFDNLTPITEVAISGRAASSNGVDMRISGSVDRAR